MSRYRLPRELDGAPHMWCARCRRWRPLKSFAAAPGRTMWRARLCLDCVPKKEAPDAA